MRSDVASRKRTLHKSASARHHPLASPGAGYRTDTPFAKPAVRKRSAFYTRVLAVTGPPASPYANPVLRSLSPVIGRLLALLQY